MKILLITASILLTSLLTFAGGSAITALTGDGTASGPGLAAFTLSNTGVSAGTYSSVTVDSKGRVTAGSNDAVKTILPPLASGRIWIGNTSNVATSQPILGDATISNTGILTLSNTSVTPGTYHCPDITVDAKGRVTAVSSSIAIQMTALENRILLLEQEIQNLKK